MKHELLNDWIELLKDFTYVNGKLKFKTTPINSESELSKTLYNNYKNIDSKKKLPSFPLNDFANNVIKKIYPTIVDTKWQIKKINTDDISFIIRKGYTERGIVKENCVLSAQTEKLSLDSEVDILQKKAYYDFTHNYIWIYGNFFPTDNNDELIRYYFNISISLNNLFLFESFLCLIINCLNEKGISFQLKFLDNLTYFNRADCFVIYIEKFHYLASYEIIEQAYNEARVHLIDKNAKRPLFTHKIADGWGFAEEPKTKDVNFSFGQHRTSIIANFIWKYLNRRSPTSFDSKGILKLFKKKYKHVEFDFENFHLNKNSIIQIKRPKLSEKMLGLSNFKINDWAIDAANVIGSHLCKQAIWGSKQNAEFNEPSLKVRKCTWLNASIEEELNLNDFYVIKSVNAGLADGLAGILYFLVKLYSIQKTSTLLNTIHGTANNLLDRIDTLNNSLTNGKVGIWLVFNELSKIEGFANLVPNRDEVNNFNINTNDGYDFYDGISGQIWGLVVLYKNTSNDILKDSISALLLNNKVQIFENVQIQNLRVGLNGLVGVALMLASMAVVLFDKGDEEYGEKYEILANEILDLILFNKTDELKSINFDIEYGWSGILIALLGGQVQLSSNFNTLLIKSFLKTITPFLNSDLKSENNFSLNSGLLGVLLSLKFFEEFKVVSNPNLVELKTEFLEDYMQHMYTEILKSNNLPPMGLSKIIDDTTRSEYYNSGIFNGISGLGLMFLKLRTTPKNNMFFIDQVIKSDLSD